MICFSQPVPSKPMRPPRHPDLPHYRLIKGPMTYREIATILGISSARVQQIEKEALRKLAVFAKELGVTL